MNLHKKLRRRRKRFFNSGWDLNQAALRKVYLNIILSRKFSLCSTSMCTLQQTLDIIVYSGVKHILLSMIFKTFF